MNNVELCKKWIVGHLEPTTKLSTSPVSSKAFSERVNKELASSVLPEDFTVAMLELGYEMREPDGYHYTFPIFKCKANKAYKYRQTRSSRYNQWYVKTPVSSGGER